MSPIFENKRIILGNVKKESGKTFDITIGVLFMFLFMPLGNFTLWSLLLFPLGIFVGFYGPVGRSFKNNFLNNFDQTYNSISLEAAKMSKKKDLTSKEVDKSVNELVTECFNYEDVLDVIGFVDDSLNHKSYLKKKVKHAVPDNKVTLQKGEILYFRTHTIWAQGSPDNNVFKDIGYFYLSNKRFIFIGEYNSHSITLSRIVNFEIGNNYALICKTAGKNEIFEINKIESLSYLKFLYEKLI